MQSDNMRYFIDAAGAGGGPKSNGCRLAFEYIKMNRFAI